MSNKNIIFAAVTFFIVSLLTTAYLFLKANTNIGNQKVDTHSQPKAESQSYIIINKQKINVQVADNDAKRSRGLSGKQILAKNEGMLFVFPQKDTRPGFWMKDMNFALDLIWINDGKIDHITKNAQPEPGIEDAKLKKYWSPNPIDMVLEINAGLSDEYSFEVGMDALLVILSSPVNTSF